MNGITSSTALWYASRATGVVALLLLSAVMILGMLVNRQGRLPGLPRFGATSLHRSVSLLSVVFVAVHVITAIADPFVTISAVAAVVPFVAAYKPFWLGLGAVSLDLIIALIITSLARARIGRKTWRGVHWLAYAAWPVAFVHSLGSSPDLRSGGFLALAIGCALAVGAAAGFRVWSSIGSGPRAQRAPRAERAARALDRVSSRASADRGGSDTRPPLMKAGRS